MKIKWEPRTSMPKDTITDHDILITLVEQVKALRDDIKDIKDTTKARVEDHETRIRGIESKIWIMVGGLTILSFATPYIWNLFTK